MRLTLSKLMMAFMILMLIGNTVIESAGATIIQSKQPPSNSHEALTSVSVFVADSRNHLIRQVREGQVNASVRVKFGF